MSDNNRVVCPYCDEPGDLLVDCVRFWRFVEQHNQLPIVDGLGICNTMIVYHSERVGHFLKPSEWEAVQRQLVQEGE
jgi:hypothetical protein